MAPLDPNWKKPEIPPGIYDTLRKTRILNIKADGYYNRRARDGSIQNINTNMFGGIYANDSLGGQLDGKLGYGDDIADAWYNAYKEYIPNNAVPSHHGNQLIGPPLDEFKRDKLKALIYARNKAMFDKLGSIKVLDDNTDFGLFDGFSCKYVDANENLGPNTYRFKMLNPIYNKIGNWWLGDKGQPIMAVPNNMNSYDGEPIVPKSYDDYLTYTEDEKNLIAKAHQQQEHLTMTTDEAYKLFVDAMVGVFGVIEDALPNEFNGQDSNGQTHRPLLSEDSVDYRDKTPLEFMSPYNPDVLVPEAKLNELAKEHPEVWKPMIFEYKGYKSICVSANGYIISAYQPAPNVFLPIHVYGLSDHRGPYGYDAAKSVIITVHNLVLGRDPNNDHGDILYNEPDASDVSLVNSDTVKQAYDDMMKVVE